MEEDARKAEPKGDGVYTYKFKYMLPADARGSGAIGTQGYKVMDLKKPNGDVINDVRDVSYNVVKYFPITDNEAVPRRQAVKIQNCNVCHAMLATHGEARRNAEFCVMCHNPSHTDEDKRIAAKGPMPPENVHYKRLIHRIHTGAAAGESFIVYGGPPTKPGPIDLGDIRFPGDRQQLRQVSRARRQRAAAAGRLTADANSTSRRERKSAATDHQRMHRLPHKRRGKKSYRYDDLNKRARSLRDLPRRGTSFPSRKCTGGRVNMKIQLTALSFLAAILLSQSLIHAEEQNEGKRMYQTYCTGCHGSSGKGDGPAAKTLPVRPADHTRAEMTKTPTNIFSTSFLRAAPALANPRRCPPGARS